MPGTDPTANVLDPLVGRTLAGRYLVKRRIGSGAMGNVYEAEHEILGRTVAVKVLHRKYTDDAQLMRRFMNEARAVGTLRHANIVESYDVAMTDDGVPFLVLEYLEGQSLARELRDSGALQLERAVRISVQLAAALHAAHQRGTVHRDIKPGNIMLVENDVVKVLDFGISKLGENEVFDTKAGSIIGSPNYMAPEQVKHAQGVDARADVYSMGAVLYEMLAGVPPFDGVPFPKILRLVRDAEPVSIEELCPTLDASVAAVVRRAMAKEVADRHQSALEFASDLQSCVSSVSGVVSSPWAARSTPGVFVTPLPARDVGSHASAPPPSKWEEWRVPLLVGVLLAVVIVLAGIWFVGASGRGASSAAEKAPETLGETVAAHARSGPGAAPEPAPAAKDDATQEAQEHTPSTPATPSRTSRRLAEPKTPGSNLPSVSTPGF